MWNPFKRKHKPEFNLNHPDVKHLIEEAFKVKGKKYYRFKEEKLIPVGRYKYIYAHLREVDMRMNLETLRNYVKEFKNLLNGSGAKKQISIGDLWKLVINLESRLNLAFEPASVERLASVIYFDDTEDLQTWDKKHGAAKVEFWKANKCMDFFLTRPMGELLGLSNISIESLEDYIQSATEILKDLTFAPSNPLPENLSENGNHPL
jgi:hypothetical protein